AEAVVFLEAYGVETTSALQVLGGGLAGSKVLDQKGQKMLDRSFDPGFRLQLHHKDMGIVTAAAREAGVAIPLGSTVAQLVASTVQQGNGGLDHSGLFTVVEQLSGEARARGPTPPSAPTGHQHPRRQGLRLTKEGRTVARMRAVDAVVLVAEKEGATETCGLPGAAINPLYSAMKAHGGIRHTLARHV